MPSGGYRKPSNPAPVSGPGALSRRTDGGPSQAAQYMAGGKYGEGKQLMETQQAAPMAASSQPRMRGPQMPSGGGGPAVVPITAPTERPDEPITHGLPFGPGGGPEVLSNGPQRSNTLSQTVGGLIQYDSTGELTDLYEYLVSRGL
jgi:hypothetical protein